MNRLDVPSIYNRLTVALLQEEELTRIASADEADRSELAKRIKILMQTKMSPNQEKILTSNLGLLYSRVFHFQKLLSESNSVDAVVVKILEGSSTLRGASKQKNILQSEERARADVLKNPGRFLRHLQEYDLTNPINRRKIFNYAVGKIGENFSRCISSYNIKEQLFLIELAEMAAVQNGEGTSALIQEYGIQDPAALIHIAKISAAATGYGASKFIQQYKIQDPAALIEIAKISAAQNGGATSYYIRNYDIQDPAALIEIAKIAAAQSGDMLRAVEKYDISYGAPLINIFRIAAKLEPYEAINKSWELFREGQDRPELRRLALFCFLLVLSREGALTKRLVSHATFIHNFPDLFEKGKLKKEIEFKEIFSRCVRAYLESYIEGVSAEEKNKIVKEISDYRGRSVAVDLLVDFCDNAQTPNFITNYLRLSRTKNEVTVHKILPSILPAKWLTLSETPLESEQKPFADFFSFGKKKLRNVDSPLMSTYLLAARALEGSDLSFERKFKVLARVGSCAGDVLTGLGLITALCSRKEEKRIDLDFSNQMIEELFDIFKRTLLSDPFLRFFGVENVAEKYLASFGRTRISMALEIYRSKIAVPGYKESVRITLERFVLSVLEGTFDRERYRTDNNPHLKHIAEKEAALFQKWQETSEPTPLAVSSGKVAPIDYEAFFRLKLRDRHWHEGEIDWLPGLTAFLEQRASEERDGVSDCCIRLCVESTLSKEEQSAILRTILEELGKRNLSSLEFCHDMQGFLSGLRTNVKSSQETVGRSTDWQDLFLSGSEVSGSCQRIDGDPDLNRCLLAYCLDGKNSVIAVKDSFNGKILARAFLRLLWDRQNDKPVLFLDRLYPDACGAERGKAILEAAKQEALRLGLNLTTRDFSVGTSYQGEIVSLGSSCPYEYADGGGGVSRNGVFSVIAPKIIMRS